jgi:hypothetical protein
MRFAGLLLSLLLLAGFAIAQSTDQDHGILHNQTIEGCLHHVTGSYQLTDHSGTDHILMGEAQQLRDHVGQEVRLTGAKDNSRDASASGNNGMMSGQRFFRVNSVEEVSASCKK